MGRLDLLYAPCTASHRLQVVHQLTEPSSPKTWSWVAQQILVGTGNPYICRGRLRHLFETFVMTNFVMHSPRSSIIEHKAGHR